MGTITVHLSHSFDLMVSGIEVAIKKTDNVVLLGISSDIQKTMQMCLTQKPKLLLVDRELLGIKILSLLSYFNNNLPYMSIVIFIQNLNESILYESPRICVAGIYLIVFQEKILYKQLFPLLMEVFGDFMHTILKPKFLFLED